MPIFAARFFPCNKEELLDAVGVRLFSKESTVIVWNSWFVWYIIRAEHAARSPRRPRYNTLIV
jgi:hypothetical protein